MSTAAARKIDLDFFFNFNSCMDAYNLGAKVVEKELLSIGYV
jgi:hypothetical protein